MEKTAKRIKEHQKKLLQQYIDNYTTLVKQMVSNYKRQAVDAYFSETYRLNVPVRYFSNKNKALKDRALYND